jgi:DNA-binding CsgD family transcriptional regulator
MTAAGHVGQLSGGLLERERELQRVEAALESAARGRGRAVLVVAGAGLGKSSLLELARGRCGELGLEPLPGRAEELEAMLPWSLARQLLVPALSGATAKRRRTLLAAAAGPAAPLLDPASVSTPADGGGGLLPLVHALFWVIAGIAERSPAALLVDDAHWGDEPSLRLLAYLARRVADLPVALIVARRPGSAETDSRALDELAGDPATELLELAPLSATAAATLAHEVLGATAPQELVNACVEATGGNPFYLRELLRALRARPAEPVGAAAVGALVPTAVSRSLFLRLSRLAPEAAGLARATSVLGDRAALPHAAELAGLDLERAAVALDQLAGAEILAQGEPLRFIHPLVSAAVHDDLPPAERADWHLRAARILDRHGVESALLAPHLLAAGARTDPWVVERLEAAAGAAAAQGGIAAAVRYLARALEEPPPRQARAGLLAELGRLESALGRPSAPDRLRAALELTGGGDQRARLLFELGRALVIAGEHGEAARAFESGLEEVEDRASELGRELQAAWWMAATADPVERARVLAAGEPEIGDGQGPPTLGQRQLLAQLSQQRAFAAHPPDELQALAQRAWSDGALLDGETSDGLSWSLVTGALLAADALEAELEVCDAVIADARRRGSPMAYATASYCRAWPLMRRGQVSDAIADAQTAVEARHDGWATFLPITCACLALAQLERGVISDAAAALALAEAMPDLERSNQYPMVLIARGRLLAAERRFEPSIRTLRRAGELLASIDFDNPTLFPWRTEAAHAAALAGKPHEALALAEAALQVAKRTQVPATVAQALRAQATATGGEQAITHLREALALLPDRPRLERIHLLVDLGAALRRSGGRTDATDALHQALALAQDGGATALADRARSELAAAGARVTRQPRSDGPQSLTPSERRIAQLAADGHTNREIARLLFLTVKTVEYHLGNTYRKLGINRRTQLARALATPH